MRLAVVGGGMAGLAAAYAAEHAAEQEGLDLEVALYEASDRLGGKVRTRREDGFVVEEGADAMLRSKPWALELAREVGLGEEIVDTLPAHPAALVATAERAWPLPAGLNLVVPGRLGPLARTPLLSVRGKLRVLADLVLPRGGGADEAFGRFVARRLGSELWGRVAAPLVGGIYGGDPAALSTEAAFPQLRELEWRRRSLILGSRRLLRERAAGRDAGAPFASFRDGLGRLAEAIAARLERTDVYLEAEVQRLEDVDADAYVLAVPAFVAAELLADAAPAAVAPLRAIPYADAAAVTLAFPECGFPAVSGHGLLYAAGEGKGVRGFTWVDRKWAGRAPGGYRLVRAFLSADGALLQDGEAESAAVGALERLLGPLPEPTRRWVVRWPRAMPQYTLGHPERLRLIGAALAETPWIRLAGSAYRGVGVPDVIRDGADAARAALAYSTQSRVR